MHLSLDGDCGSKNERVVMYRAWDFATTKSGANFQTLGGKYAKHSMRKHAFYFIKHGLSQSTWNVLNNAGDRPSNTVFSFLELCDALGHLLRCRRIWALNGHKLLNFFSRNRIDNGQECRIRRWTGMCCSRRKHVYGSNGRHKSNDFYPRVRA